MKGLLHYFLSVPVTIVLLTVITTMYLLYQNGLFAINCQHSFLAEVQSFFLHASIAPLLTNILAILLMSRLEYDMGSPGFLLAFVSLLVLCSLTEFILRFSPIFQCSIGISSVFLGLAVVELITDTKKMDWNAVMVIVLIVLYPNMMDPATSLTGYLSGALMGVVVGFIYSRYMVASLKAYRHTHRDEAPVLPNYRFKLQNPLDLQNTKNPEMNLPFRHK